MFDFIADLDGWAQWLLAVGGALALLAGFWRWFVGTDEKPGPWRRTRRVTRAVVDTLVGREATHDSITGEEIRPAIPGIGARMAEQEKHAAQVANDIGILTRAVADLARTSERLDAVERNHADLAQRVTAVEQGHFLERMAGKAESIQLFRTIEQVAKSDEPEADI